MSLTILATEDFQALCDVATNAYLKLPLELQERMDGILSRCETAATTVDGEKKDLINKVLDDASAVCAWSDDELNGAPIEAVVDIAGEAGDRFISDFADRKIEYLDEDGD